MSLKLLETDKLQNSLIIQDEGGNNRICVNPKIIYIKEDEIFKLTATICTENFSDKSVIWSTSDPNVATVINGEVKAKSIGRAYIYAELLDDGRECDCCCVNVQEQKQSNNKERFWIFCKKIFNPDKNCQD